MEPRDAELLTRSAVPPTIEQRFQTLREKCDAHHDQLVSISSYAVSLVDACREEAERQAQRVLQDAYERADAILREAQAEADRIRSDAGKALLHPPVGDSSNAAADAGSHAAAAPAVEDDDEHAPATGEMHVERFAPEPAPTRPVLVAMPHDGTAREAESPTEDTVSVPATLMVQPAEPPLPDTHTLPLPEESTGRSAARAFAVMGVAALAILTGGWFLQRSWHPGSEARAQVARPSASNDAGTRDRPSVADAAAAPTAAAPTPAATSGEAPLTVALSAQRRAWLRIGSDDHPPREGFIEPGEHRTITAQRMVTLRTGDAGAVLAAVNGRPAAPLGRDGVVLSRRFTADGVDGADAPGARAVDTAAAARTSPAPTPSGRNASEARTAVATAGVDATHEPRTAASDAAAEPVRAQILRAEHEWFTARYRGDHGTMARIAAPDFQLIDERPESDRVAPAPSVVRTVKSATVETWGDSAVVTGEMVERGAAGSSDERVTSFAETWLRRDGRWQLMGLRLH